MQKLGTLIAVAAGSAIGGVLRHWLGLMIAQRLGSGFPWGTLFVNVTGSFLIGFIAAIADTRPDTHQVSQGMREFLMVGVLGGYTTFSAFSLQTLTLIREGRVMEAGANAVGSVVLCLVAVWLGYLIGSALRSR